jgi:hypothetical protein
VIKEALIKSGAQIAQSDFSADYTEILQAYWRMSRNFCVIWREICKQDVCQAEGVI